MLDEGRKVRAKRLLANGVSKRATAAAVGVARRTLYNWIARDWAGAKRAPARKSRLDDYKPFIDARLAAYPKLSAARLYESVRRAGFEGSYSVVVRYVRGVRPCPAPEPVQRFETEPGRQGQVDFAEFKFPWGKRYALAVVLGYSRWLWVGFYERETMAALADGLERAFAAMGGVPGELLFDQMKAVVNSDERPAGGKLIENASFRGFADHWGFRIRACRPYRAQTKGKVERPIRYLRENFFYGREFANDEEVNERLRGWLSGVANVRVHGTLKERVSDRFERERPLLLPLAPRGYRFVTPRPMPEEAGDVDVAPAEAPAVDVEKRPLAYYADRRRDS